MKPRLYLLFLITLCSSEFSISQTAVKIVSDNSISMPPPLESIQKYANGKIEGHWQLNHFDDNETGTYGHRTVASAYDSIHNKAYILTDNRNVLSCNLLDSGALTMTNSKVLINGNLFVGTVTKKNSFRLLGAIQPEWDRGGIYYSDNEAKDWTKSKGIDLSNQEIRWSSIMNDANKTILLLTVQALTKANAKLEIYSIFKSTNNGESFSILKKWQEKDAEKITACKPYNSDTCYFLFKVKNTNNIRVQKLNLNTNEFDYISTIYTPKTPQTFVGTSIKDTTYLYIGTAGGGFYSDDFGKNWKSKPLKEKIIAIHPLDKNLLIEKSAQNSYSKNGGTSWMKLKWWEQVFGWDLAGFDWYKTKKGEWVGILTNDFGAHFTTNYTDSASWKHLNTNNIHMILHHGAYNESTDLLITCNQDRGTMLWEKEKEGYYKGVTTTKADGLRVCIAKQGNSYWYMHYWNTIYHKDFVKNRKEKLDSLVTTLPQVLKDTTWYTPSMQPSWKKNEDAVFMAGNGKIIKLSYDEYYQSISKLELPFNFQDSTSEVISGLGTTKADSCRMYAATKNGKFYYSTDLGKSWTATSYKGKVPYVKNRPWWGPHGYVIKTASDNADFVCWAGEGDLASAFLISTDGGKTFKTATNGLPPFSQINDFCITPQGKYIITNNMQIYSKDDDRWYDMRTGGFPYNIDINAVEYIQKQNTIRFFTYGLGVLDFVITKS